MVYHACLPSMLIKIVHDGLSRAVGLGAWAMKEVFWITAAGVYCVDRPETACNEPLVPASGGGNVEKSWERVRHDLIDSAVQPMLLQEGLFSVAVSTANPHGYWEQAVMSACLFRSKVSVHGACVNGGKQNGNATSLAACYPSDNS